MLRPRSIKIEDDVWEDWQMRARGGGVSVKELIVGRMADLAITPPGPDTMVALRAEVERLTAELMDLKRQMAERMDGATHPGSPNRRQTRMPRIEQSWRELRDKYEEQV